MRVVIIDDSSLMRRVEKIKLAELGITDVLEADNGLKGLELLRSGMPVDYVLLDINMPVMDGMECLRRIRSDRTLLNVKVSMVTSESEKKKILEAIRAGANDYIVKPFTDEAFRQRFGG